MSAGRRRGETRRTRHDPLASASQLDRRDADLVRKLLEDDRLAAAARVFIGEILTASGAALNPTIEIPPNPGISRDAAEDLAHGLVRAALDPGELKRRIAAMNPRRGHLIDRDVNDKDLTQDERAELARLESEITTLVALLTTPRKPLR